MKRVLLTTTSYQDTPGDHHALLEGQDFEIVRERGPLTEERMLELAGDFDAFLCGDDAITREVIEKSLPRLQVISKYGIGLDKIDLATCNENKLPVLFTPGVNHTTVAEHCLMLLLAISKQLVDHANWVRAGEWKRKTGHEIWKKRIGLAGFGRIGREVALRAKAFEMEVTAFDIYWPEEFANEHGFKRAASLDELFETSDVLSLHTNLSEETRGLVNAERLAKMPKDSIVLNTARGELVDNDAIIAALDSGQLAGYGTDVLDVEPPEPDHPLIKHPKVLVTPHIGSRTYESVPRQAMRATENLIHFLSGKGEYLQANKFD
ncbi:MAG: phosphoglycerate dehydrogenase [Verrucomicrobiales bacterium]